MEIIRFESMSFAYAGCDQPALRELSFGIKPSEFIVVCGRSGCGKSTLLRHMKRELAPDGDREGQVLYNGTDVEELAKRVSAAEIGFVHQNPERQIVTDKVWHELAFGLESLGYSSKIIRRRVAEMASFFGIQTWFRKSVFELSGGPLSSIRSLPRNFSRPLQRSIGNSALPSSSQSTVWRRRFLWPIGCS